ncbi:MAG: hypothetical protein KBT88_11140 [Gammaproteobacteria bacterium]|nr:hypothetical protein [Gammaproteobacteria bacterium]MBQ0840329.1 hypothetical protein [Gammaproteobacteria bacterium]
MLFAADEFRQLIIRDTLKSIDEWAPAHENLLLGTAAQESGMGLSLKRGRLLGIYHISPNTHRSVWDKYLLHHPDLASRVRGLAGQHSFIREPHGELISNLKYATAIAWLIYRRADEVLPADDDIAGLARYWHRHFRSKASASVAEFMACYQDHIVGKHECAA